MKDYGYRLGIKWPTHRYQLTLPKNQRNFIGKIKLIKNHFIAIFWPRRVEHTTIIIADYIILNLNITTFIVEMLFTFYIVTTISQKPTSRTTNEAISSTISIQSYEGGCHGEVVDYFLEVEHSIAILKILIWFFQSPYYKTNTIAREKPPHYFSNRSTTNLFQY